MTKPPMPRVTEPDEGLVHYDSAPGQDYVTLCGRTDWIGVTPGKATRRAVTCRSCIEIKAYCDSYRADAEGQP